jgi:hypothetical protein
MKPAVLLRTYAIVSAVYLFTRVLLHSAGLRFSFDLDWMWLADPLDLRTSLGDTLLYFHAFPPGINALTGLLLKSGELNAPVLAHTLFTGLGLLLANTIAYLAIALGLPPAAAVCVAVGFSVAPATIYFEHLFHYEWLVIALLCVSAVLFHRAVWRPTAAAWLGFFGVGTAVGVTRSTFHLVWFVALTGLAVLLAGREARRRVVSAAVLPAALLVALYAKNLVLFGDFAASTFGPASLTLVTVDRLPREVRDAWIAEGRLSPFAAISVYAPPRSYQQFFPRTDHGHWPPQLTRLEHRGVEAANFNHWWLLDVHHTRRGDALTYLRERPGDYLVNVLHGLGAMLGPTTTWHPRDDTALSPHHQHRQILGGYERWFNRAVHSRPIAPVGIYILLPLVAAWTCVRAWQFVRDDDRAVRARGALLALCVFHIAYVVSASTMLTFLESSRYRFQIEWAIWLLGAFVLTDVTRLTRRLRTFRPRPIST